MMLSLKPCGFNYAIFLRQILSILDFLVSNNSEFKYVQKACFLCLILHCQNAKLSEKCQSKKCPSLSGLQEDT